MENQAPLRQEESLRIIQQMIETSKNSLRDDGTLYLLWGWLVFLSSIGHYALMAHTSYAHPYMVWLSMPLAGIFTGIYVARMSRKARVRTLVDEFMMYLWTAFIISMISLMWLMPKIGYAKTFPLVMILYAIGTFVSGGALRFKPLMVGGALNWAIALFAFYRPFQEQLLLLALAVACSYIIPGHWLKITHKKQHV
ncbi:hypothetical protein QWY31_15090 [Cytophagales bacterium LB-30]|uniref:DUF2878 domain-containing protein n=1 Tax=Shiella aurantiaca TaxID=3058365 RepID=A0ABT8F8X1_9BACT|nr:hypothetical protein [Shiella aurantiaca]MDN4166835.1 hypothetical protein [Shiella aurantiaca]